MVDKYQFSPLHSAAQNGHVNVIKELLEGLTKEERLAYLNKATIIGVRALNMAIKKEKHNVISILKEYGVVESWYDWWIGYFFG